MGNSVPPPPTGGGGGLFDKLDMSLSAGYDTDYVFRGYDIGHDHVWTQIDASIPIGDQFEIAVGAWYTTAFNDGENELDLYASFGYNFGPVGVEVGYTHYSYPNGILSGGNGSNGGETNEAYVSLGTTVGNVDLGVAYYYDFDLETSYIEAKAGTSIPLGPNVSLDPSVGISWVDADSNTPGVEDSGWNHFFARVELPIKLTASATLTPYVATSMALDVADSFGQNDQFWGGVALKVSF